MSERDEIERGASLWAGAARRLLRDRAATAAALVLLALVAACVLVPAFSAYRYDKTDLALGPTPPSWAHWMGTDFHGRDLLARVFFGGRISFTVGVVATVVSFAIGVTWGGVAGYLGGRADAVMMRVVDGLYTLPLLVILILVKVFFGGGRPEREIVLTFVCIGAISWLTMARIVRGQVVALREQPFVEAARSIGAGRAALIFRHLLPNAMGPLIVYAALIVPEVMMTEAFLSFLGLGTQEPLSSWGQLAALGAETMDLYPWMLIFPALMLALTLYCFNVLGEALRDALDPRSHSGARRASPAPPPNPRRRA